jgi:hypothetical protein
MGQATVALPWCSEAASSCPGLGWRIREHRRCRMSEVWPQRSWCGVYGESDRILLGPSGNQVSMEGHVVGGGAEKSRKEDFGCA